MKRKSWGAAKCNAGNGSPAQELASLPWSLCKVCNKYTQKERENEREATASLTGHKKPPRQPSARKTIGTHNLQPVMIFLLS